MFRGEELFQSALSRFQTESNIVIHFDIHNQLRLEHRQKVPPTCMRIVLNLYRSHIMIGRFREMVRPRGSKSVFPNMSQHTNRSLP